MARPTAEDHQQILELSWTLGAVRNEAELAAVATLLLPEIAHTDEAGFSKIDPAHGGVTHIAVYPHPQQAQAIRARLATVIDEYPVTVHLARDPMLVPLRLSDITPYDRFRHSRAYATMFEPRNLHHQLVLPLTADPTGRSRTTYSLTRSGSDFTDQDVDRAYRLHTLLSALHSATCAPRSSGERLETGMRQSGLTARELDILTLLATGMTGQAIAHARRIRTRTVRKHLENIYRKLDIHDRLRAVTEARRLGLLPLIERADRESDAVSCDAPFVHPVVEVERQLGAGSRPGCSSRTTPPPTSMAW